MGKLSAKARDALLASGTLSEAAVSEMQKHGQISEAKQVVKKYIKTADGKWVEPKLYFRGGKNVQKSKKMESFISDYNNLLDKYTTTRNNK